MKQATLFQKLMSVFLCAVMLLSVLPVNAFAAEEMTTEAEATAQTTQQVSGGVEDNEADTSENARKIDKSKKYYVYAPECPCETDCNAYVEVWQSGKLLATLHKGDEKYTAYVKESASLTVKAFA